MKTSHLTEPVKVADTKARPSQEADSASSSELATLRSKVISIEKNIPTQTAQLSKNEGLLATYQSGDKALLEAEGISKQQINALATVTAELKQQINTSRSELQSYELIAKAAEYQTHASENGAAYETVVKALAPEIKQEMTSDDQHSGLIKEQFKYQVKTGQEAMAFWGNEKNFWTEQIAAGGTKPENKEKVAALYDQVFALETQINSLFGSSAKEEKEGLKSKLSAVKNEVSAIHSGAST